VARKFNFESAYPILIVTDVQAGGAADRAGLEPGDLLLQINDATVRDLQEFSLQMEKVAEGDVVELRILRITLGLFGQMERRLLVRLQARAQETQKNAL
jgi:S1-C subfamily serine protease